MQIKKSEDEHFDYFEGEIEFEGNPYTVRITRCKICPKTNLPIHLSNQRLRYNKEMEEECKN